MKITTFAEHLQLKTRLVDSRGQEQVTTRDMTVYQGFTKPDKPVINLAAQDGYRRPSSYSCPGFSYVDRLGGQQHKFRIYELNGSGSLPWPWYYNYEFSGRGYTSLSGSWSPPAPNVNAVRSKLLNNVRNEVLDVAMVLAEMQGTANTVTNGLMRIARSMDAIKKGNPRHYSYLLSGRLKDNRRPTDKFLRESSGIFLEWKYGIMPTVYDVAGACKALDMNKDGSLWDNPPLLVARATEVTSGTVTHQGTAVSASGDSARFNWDSVYRSEYKARLDYTVTGEGLRGLNRYGLGLSSIPTVLFDRTPFSFVLNMAIPISELIKAWTALAGCDVRGYSETLHQRVSFPKGSHLVKIRDIPCTVELPEQPDYVTWQRNAFASVPMPMPYVRNPIKTGNLATVIALFTQLRKPS